MAKLNTTGFKQSHSILLKVIADNCLSAFLVEVN